MKTKKNKLLLLLGLLIIFGFYLNQSKETNSNPIDSHTSIFSYEIDHLTSEELVVAYLKSNYKLPDYYITKKEAREKGWVASEENLCEVLPDKAIGGDKFENREKKLPQKKGRVYYEADINYNCGRRGSQRLVFSNDGLIYITKDHYKTFKMQ